MPSFLLASSDETEPDPDPEDPDWCSEEAAYPSSLPLRDLALSEESSELLPAPWEEEDCCCCFMEDIFRLRDA